MSNLGERIKIVRIQKKMSQADLANAAGVHQKNISKYEGGGVVPSALILKEMARALGVTADYLLGSDQDDLLKDPNSFDRSLYEKIALVDGLTKEQKDSIFTFIDLAVVVQV